MKEKALGGLRRLRAYQCCGGCLPDWEIAKQLFFGVMFAGIDREMWALILKITKGCC